MKSPLIYIAPMLVFLTLLTACNGKDLAPPSGPEQPETAASAEAPPVRNEDDNYVYNRELIDFSMCGKTYYEAGIIDFPLVEGQMPSITCVDDELNLYSLTTSGSAICELGKYSLEEKKYTAIVTLDSGSASGFILGVSNDYIVWKEVITTAQKQTAKLHLCNKSGKEDMVFYTDAVDPETGSVYVINLNSVVIFENTVFFDEVTGYSANGTVEMNVLCYDILTKEITLISRMSKRPGRYLNGISYLKCGEGLNSTLYSYINGKESLVIALDADTADYTISGSTIYKSVFNYEGATQEKRSIVSTNLYLGEDPLPLIEGKQSNYTYAARSNDMVMVWEVTNPEKPVYYDIIDDRFVRLGSEKTGYYSSFVGKDFVLFLTLSDPNDSQSSLQYILIRMR